MCTYQTERLSVEGSGKGNGKEARWFRLTDATVYLDHPVHAPADHTLNIDFLRLQGDAIERVAVELDPRSARALATSILSTLDALAEFVTEP
ncbi:MAG: DUF6295 family protein [Actinomycetota bacterium]